MWSIIPCAGASYNILRAPLKIRFFIINKIKKSNFHIESAQGNRPNLIFRGSLNIFHLNIKPSQTKIFYDM